MAFTKSKDGKELILDCNCGCDTGVRMRIDKDEDVDYYFWLSYFKGDWYTNQGLTFLRILVEKVKKIWRIVRSKDFYYSELCMTKAEFDEFREYLNSIQ